MVFDGASPSQTLGDNRSITRLVTLLAWNGMAKGQPRTELAARRRAAGFSQEALAHALQISVTALATWEQGRRTPLARLRQPLADALGVTMVELERLLDPSVAPSLNGDGLAAVAEWLSLFVRAEQQARAVEVVELTTWPALLQTEAYARAVELASHRPATASQVAEMVRLRLARQSVLRRQPDALAYRALVPLDLLGHDLCGSAVLAEQLAHVAEVASWPNVELRLVPGVALVSVPASFVLLTTPGAPRHDLAVEFGLHGPNYAERADAVADFSALFDRLAYAALSPAESLDLITATERTTK
jgi:transcriptional regulator with XRE-family HTH domain